MIKASTNMLVQKLDLLTEIPFTSLSWSWSADYRASRRDLGARTIFLVVCWLTGD
jgi:hypothetical protein